MGNTGVSGLGLDYDPATKVSTKYNNKTIDTTVDAENSSYMDFDSYLKLLVAQMSNQDFNDPMSDAEVLNQMATYSMLEGIKNMTSQSNISYASSLVGKAVTVVENDVYDTGIIESVVVDNGTPYLIVNGVKHGVSTISDIVDVDKYKDLSSVLGKTATTTIDGTAITGTVSNVLILYGVELIVIDGDTICAKSLATFSDGTKTSDTDNSAVDNVTNDDANSESVTTDEPAEENVIIDTDTDSDDYTVTDDVDENIVAGVSSTTNNNTVSTSYEQRADALFAELMSTLDGVTSVSNDDTADDSERIYITEVDTPDYAAAVYGEDSNINSISLNSNLEFYGNNSEIFNNYSSASTSSYIAKNPIVTSNSPLVRKNADIYTAEAAKADAYGTRMYDISWINNTSICSQIKSSPVLGYTASGRGVTDLGFSGQGKLGEVVTFADGTQRVEILHNNGNSSWLYTSGNYTLDEFCTPNFVPQNGTHLTPYEIAIQNYAIQDEVMGNSASTTQMWQNFFANYGFSTSTTN